MKKCVMICCILAILLGLSISAALAAENARMPAIKDGANRLVAQQRTDANWEGTWRFVVGFPFDATNLTGVTALGLLEAFRDAKDSAYLEAAKKAAQFVMVHLGVGATGVKHHIRWTAPDVIFVHHLGKVAGDTAYNTRATQEWENIKASYPTAGDLDGLFHDIQRQSIWDFAFFMEAAHLSGDQVWADQAAAIIANTADSFYYDQSSGWYALNVASAIRSLINCGYAATYQAEIISLLNILVGLCDAENGIDGYIQDTAYAVLAFNSVGGPARSYANELGRWLSYKQYPDGGWREQEVVEYLEVDGEAVRAISSTIGTNFTLDGFEPGIKPSSAWRKAIPEKAEPFLED